MLSTRPKPQVVYALSLGNENSSHLARLRERALAGDGGVCWVEWSMADDDRVDDRAVWARCNPAYPARISMEYMEREFAALGPDAFARERLGRSVWPSGNAGEWEAISEDAWSACYAPGVTVGPSPVPVAEVGTYASPPRPEWESWPGGVPPWLSLV
jgi:hypothetical protein